MVYALVVLEPDGMVHRGEVRDTLDAALRRVSETITGPDRETWGTSAEAQAALRQAELQFGAPAP